MPQQMAASGGLDPAREITMGLLLDPQLETRVGDTRRPCTYGPFQRRECCKAYIG